MNSNHPYRKPEDMVGPFLGDEHAGKAYDDYEWKAMSDWLRENEDKPMRLPMDDGWDIVGGALRRPKKAKE